MHTDDLPCPVPSISTQRPKNIFVQLLTVEEANSFLSCLRRQFRQFRHAHLGMPKCRQARGVSRTEPQSPHKTHSNDAFVSLGQAKVSRGMAFFPTVMHQTPQNMEQRHNNDGDLSLTMGWEALCRCVVAIL